MSNTDNVLDLGIAHDAGEVFDDVRDCAGGLDVSGVGGGAKTAEGGDQEGVGGLWKAWGQMGV